MDIHDLYSGILSNVHQEKPHPTMDKKLIINCAPTGAFMNRQQNPGQPYTMEENVAAVVEAHKAGAAVWHVHARDKDGTPSKDPLVLKETIARVLDKCPDIITSVIPYDNYDAQGVDLIKRTVDVLTAAGPEFMQSAVLLIQATAFSEKFVYVVTERRSPTRWHASRTPACGPSTRRRATRRSRTCSTGWWRAASRRIRRS